MRVLGLCLVLFLAILNAGWRSETAQAGPPAPPGAGYSFLVQVEGFHPVTFRSVEGLRVDIEVIEFSEGGANSGVHKLPGRVKYPNIVLKQGFGSTDLDEFRTWFRGLVAGQDLRKSVSVSVIGSDGRQAAKYDFTGCFIAWYCILPVEVGGTTKLEERIELALGPATSTFP